jgi:S-formylglutathione hydrolase FrmB
MISGTDTLNGIPVDWAIERDAPGDPPSDPTKLLWYFHGAGSNAQSFFASQTWANMRAAWIAAGIAPPVGLAVSFNPSERLWLIDDVPSQWVFNPNAVWHPVMVNWFCNVVRPFVEAKVPDRGTAPRRLLCGASMGGYSALHLLMWRAAQFEKVAVGCPLLITINPWSTQAEVDSYKQRTGATQAKIDRVFYILGRDLKNLVDWTRNDPLTLAAPALPTFVWFNSGDDFGFQEGCRLFATKPNVTSLEVPGEHLTITPEVEAQLAQFLV